MSADTAMRMAVVLEQYADAVARMVAQPKDQGRDAQVRAYVDALRLYAAMLPTITVPWTEVLIRHFELAHAMWQVQSGRRNIAELRKLHRDHAMAVDSLRERCARLGQSAATGPPGPGESS